MASSGCPEPASPRWIDIDTSADHACAVRSDGMVQCWGRNTSDQTAVPAELKATQVTVGGETSCALSQEDEIVCWGNNDFGLLDSPDGLFKDLDITGWCGFAVSKAGEVDTWGDEQCPPTQLSGMERVEAGMGAYSSYACGIHSNKTVRCWGEAEHGENVAPEGTFKDIDCRGDWYSLGVSAIDGELVCWAVVCPDLPSGEHTMVSSYLDHFCAVSSDGKIACAGRDISGETNPPTETDYRQVSIGGNYACAITKGGELECWGCENACPTEVGCGNYDWGQCDPPALDDE